MKEELKVSKNKKTTSILIACIALIIIVALIGFMSNFNKDSKHSGYVPPTNINIESLPINEITTYKESIENGKVEIDGISYDVQYISKASYTYDDNRNVIKTVWKNDDSETHVEFLYKNNHIIEEKRYSNDKLSYTTTYYYENDLLVGQTVVYKSGSEARTKYSYGNKNKTKTATHYNSDDSIAFIATEYLDDDGRMLKGVITTEGGEVTDTTTMYYENDLLVKSIRKKDDGAINTYNTEYNNVGDKIKEYNIFSYQEENLLIATFYDIEYNEYLLPKTITFHQVQSKIAAEDIKDYE